MTYPVHGWPDPAGDEAILVHERDELGKLQVGVPEGTNLAHQMGAVQEDDLRLQTFKDFSLQGNIYSDGSLTPHVLKPLSRAAWSVVAGSGTC